MKRLLGHVKIVLDTNIIISGLLSKASPPAMLLQAWPESEFSLVTSQHQIAELKRVLEYPHIPSRINTEQSLCILNNIESLSDILDEIPVGNYSSDPDDNFILATAIAGSADYIISGDK